MLIGPKIAVRFIVSPSLCTVHANLNAYVIDSKGSWAKAQRASRPETKPDGAASKLCPWVKELATRAVKLGAPKEGACSDSP